MAFNTIIYFVYKKWCCVTFSQKLNVPVTLDMICAKLLLLQSALQPPKNKYQLSFNFLNITSDIQKLSTNF